MCCMLAETNATSPACGVATAISESEASTMVNLHNEHRRVEGSDEFALVSIQTDFVSILSLSLCVIL